MIDMRFQKNAGVTFIEIIMVMVVASIIGVIILYRLMGTGAELIAQTDVIKTHLRYAQARAMSSDVIWGIHCDGDFYWLFNDGDMNNKIVLPGEDSDTVDLADKGISLMENFTLSFDDRGIPHAGDSAADGSELTTGHDLTQITVEDKYITITPNTGFIP